LAVALAATLASSAAGQEREPVPGISGTPGRPTRHAVVDLRTLPAAPLSAEAQRAGEAAPAPMPLPPDREEPVPQMPSVPAEVIAEPPLGPSPAITEGFEALPDNMLVIPPDTHGAVGPGHLMVSLNSDLRVQDRSGTPLATASLNSFWSPVNGGSGAFDPRTIYDPYDDRFVTVACDDARSATSAILIGATQTNDPLGTWDIYRVDADAGNTLWADFPSVGFNDKWVVVQVNMFRISDDLFDRSHVFVFDRAQLYQSSAPFVLIPDATSVGTQSPALTYDPSQSELFLIERWNGSMGRLRLSKLSGAVGSPLLSLVGQPVGPSWLNVPPAANHAPQSGSAQRIATNDARIQNLVYRNGTLWTTHTVFSSSPDRASVQWWEISTAGATLQVARIDDTTGANFYAFPSIAVNKLGDALLGFSCFSATRFASACHAFRKSSDAPNTFQDPVTLKGGDAKYYKTFFPPNTVNRWGDYSATQTDPFNDVDFWTIQEYAMLPSGPPTPQDRWGTWWGHLALPPDITIGDVSLVEGNSGTTNARFTISLSFASTQLVEVDWVATNGSATLADSDFQNANGRASFPPGTTTQVVDVPVVGDLKLEPNETLTVDLSNPLFGVITDAQGQGTIVNDDPIPRMSIDDVRVVEGNAGPASAIFTVTLSNPSAAAASASWSTADGSAVQPGDYATDTNTVSFAAGDTSETLTVLVAGDVAAEPNETFYVNLSAPIGAVLGDRRGVGTILDDDGPSRLDVSSFTIVSDGASGATSGRNLLQWVNPVGGSPIELRIRYNKSLGCTPPTDPDGTYDGLISLFPPFGNPGERRSFDHTSLELTSYCYTFWVIHTGNVASPGVSAIGRPFNATGKLKWKYATGTGTTGVAPPTIALEGILAVDNSGDVHAMRRSATGGPWPGGPPAWNPLDLGSPSQARNPIVPSLAGSRAFISTQDGRVHAVDTKTGAVDWSTALAPGSVTGAPAGIFTAFGGQHDAIFAGTSVADDNVFHALDPGTGAPITFFGPPGNPGIGPIGGMAVVDYSRAPQNRVCFASRQGSAPETLWCLNLGAPGSLAFTLRWKAPLGNISGSAVLRDGRIYVGTDAGEVKSVRADDGLDVRSIALGDGPVRGFVFPDRASGDVYVSTSNTVWRLTDSTGGWVNPWGPGVGVSVANPSPPLLWPGTTRVFVGGGDGKLHQLRTSDGAVQSLALDYDPTAFVVGAPSLDLDFNLVHVGSVRGVFYAVQVPLP
jgi:hypothetical protein